MAFSSLCHVSLSTQLAQEGHVYLGHFQQPPPQHSPLRDSAELTALLGIRSHRSSRAGLSPDLGLMWTFW